MKYKITLENDPFSNGINTKVSAGIHFRDRCNVFTVGGCVVVSMATHESANRDGVSRIGHGSGDPDVRHLWRCNGRCFPHTRFPPQGSRKANLSCRTRNRGI